MRYSGKLGIAQQTEVSPGVWEETIIEHDIIGDMKQRTETFDMADSILPRTATTTNVSVLARSLGQPDTSMYRYLTYAGKNWTISSIVHDHPRLVMYIGEEYHGPTPE